MEISEFKGMFNGVREIGLGEIKHGLIKVRVRLAFASWGSDKGLEFMMLMINSYSHLEIFHAG